MNFTEQEMRDIAAIYLKTSPERISLVTFVDVVNSIYNHTGTVKDYSLNNSLVFAKRVNFSAEYGLVATGGFVSTLELSNRKAGGCVLVPQMNANGRMIPDSMSKQMENMVFDRVVIEGVSVGAVQIFGYLAVQI